MKGVNYIPLDQPSFVWFLSVLALFSRLFKFEPE